jgi:Ser/Thr protein kinase RdoA (MazF antagonist)
MASRTDLVLPPAADGPLPGGTANRGRVIRVGATVHRPCGTHTAGVHALLRHVAGSGFAGVPRVVGVDGSTEILDYIEGDAATEPLADWALTEDALASVGTLLRDYHRHAGRFEGAKHHWQRPVPTRWQGPLITHNDVNPANVIFRDGIAVALIDFDLAGPGTPAWDLALAACFWAPLRDPADVTDRRRDLRALRYRLILDSYGADAALRRDVTDALAAANQWISDVIEDAANNGHPAFGSLWQRDHDVHRRAAGWLAEHVAELRQAARP